MSKFSENIRYLRNKKKLSQEALADELDITRSKVSAYEEARSEPNFKTLVSFSNFFKLPIDALIKTDLTLNKEGAFLDIGSNRILFPVLIDENNQDTIEIVPIKASAGYLQGYSDTEYISNLPIMNLGFLPTGKYRAFPIQGDSMYPRVKEGDFVVGKFMENPKMVKNDNCYIILTKEDGLVYKRVRTHNMENGYLELASDNKLYHPYELHLSEVLEIWEFTVNLNLGQYREDEINPANIMSLLRSVGVDLKQLKNKVDSIELRNS
jgi:transcriptional regulator with XRE-family HTH domain